SPAAWAKPPTRRVSRSCSRTSRSAFSTPTPTMPSSTPVTDRIRPWEPNAPTWRNGATGVGETPAGDRTPRRLDGWVAEPFTPARPDLDRHDNQELTRK